MIGEAWADAWWPESPPGHSTWAVFDCAREPGLYARLAASRLEVRCLYAGRIPSVLERVAPHLVELPPGHRLARQLAEEGFGRSWGVVLRTAAPESLRHRLRKLLKVRSDDGRVLLFRWYDPRVLRAFLPTADAAQLDAFFGDIVEWFAEDGQGGWLAFGRDAAGRLRRSRLQPVAG